MLKPAFAFAFEEFRKIETKIQFFASLREVSSALNDGYLKWTVDGWGEAFGFMLKLKSNGSAFTVKTFVVTENLNPSDPIEWLIDAESLEIAEQVFTGLELNGVSIAWRADTSTQR